MEKGRTMYVCIATERAVLDIYDQLASIWNYWSMDMKHRVLEWIKINQVIFPLSPLNHNLEMVFKRNGW